MRANIEDPMFRTCVPLILHGITFLLVLLLSFFFLPSVYYGAGYRTNLIKLLPELCLNYMLAVVPFSLTVGLVGMPKSERLLIERLKVFALVVALLGIAMTVWILGYLPILVEGDKELARQAFGIFGINLLTSFWIFGLLLSFSSVRSSNTLGKFALLVFLCFPILLLQRLYLGLALITAAVSFLFGDSRGKFRKVLFYLIVAVLSFAVLLLIRTNGNLNHLRHGSNSGYFSVVVDQFVIYYTTAFVNSVQYLSRYDCSQLNSNGVGMLGPFYPLIFKHTLGWFDINFSAENFVATLTHPAYNTWMRLLDYCVDTGGRIAWVAAFLDGVLLSFYYICAPPFLRRAVYPMFLVILFFFPMGFYHLTANFTVGYMAVCIVGWSFLLRIFPARRNIDCKI